jgi:hypothetical protein
MYDCILEADIHRLRKEIRDTSSRDQRRVLEEMLDRKERLWRRSFADEDQFA